MKAWDESDPFVIAVRKHQTAEELAEIEAIVENVTTLLARLEESLENDADG